MRILTSFLAIIFVVTGCSKLEPISKQNVKADPIVTTSFVLANAVKPTRDKANLVILKSALEKEFLIHAEIITQTDAPQFQALKSRVIAFRQVGNKVYVLEATQGHVVTVDLPSTLVLAALPVLKETENQLVVDFNTGFAELYTAEDWRASDLGGPVYNPSEEFKSARLKYAHLSELRFTTNNSLAITQRGQIQYDSQSGLLNIPTEVRYYLSPYVATAGFEPLRTTNFKRLGFFEVAPQYTQDDVSAIYATRHNPALDKQIIYALSANTPAEFRAAIREGALYWNAVYGYEKIQVVDAPAGVSAPNPDYNVLQWVNWDTAGMAYADAQMDPRNGEIRHAQVYMTSVFALSGKHRARQILRKLNSSSDHAPHISLKGFSTPTLCDHFDVKDYKHNLQTLLAANVSDDVILATAQDYVRFVIAHEVGHTLGLRHNFAGSLHSNRSPAQTDLDFISYLQSSTVADVNIYSSSVMEYPSFAASTLTGRQMLGNKLALPYDQIALDVLYNGRKELPASTPLFCTDSMADKMLGCHRRDVGPSAIEDAIYTESAALDNIPAALIEKLILAKFPLTGIPPREFNEVEFNTEPEANALMGNRDRLLEYLYKESTDLAVLRSLGKSDALNAVETIKARQDYFDSELHRLGGIDKLFPEINEGLSEKWLIDFKKMIQSDSYRKGYTFSGYAYELSDADVAAATQIAEKYFVALQNDLIKAELASYAGDGTFMNFAASDSLADLFFARAKKYILTTTGDTYKDKIHIPGKADKSNPEVPPTDQDVDVELPIFKYSQDVRKSAAGLFANRKAQSLVWGLDRQETLKLDFNNYMKSVLADTELSSVKTPGHSPTASRWLAENKVIAAELLK